ncbi:TIGR03619 family F420-dependent LLM class oxidoreductase [Streptomyces noursei]|nr:TIGR03619 family F420-dependent LLM class oxidoreductase [Streptomyces noursei]
MVQVLPQGRLAYGMQLPVQARSTLFAEGWEASAGPEDLVAVARSADRAGFAYVACCEHVAIPRRLAGAMGTAWYDPVATLSYLAAATERVRLLSHVAVVGLRHPLLGAKQYATLDHLSGGRLILGVGAGHVREEFEAVGVDFARRGAVLDETIDALKAALGEEEFLEFKGEHFAFEGLGQAPRPVQTPRPPVWVGARPRRRYGGPRCGDGWLPQGTGGTGCRGRSRRCTGSGRRPGWSSRSRSGRSRSRCMWASPGGTWGGGRWPGRRSGSPGRCASTRRWGCGRSRCGSAAAAARNWSRRSRPSGPRSDRC